MIEIDMANEAGLQRIVEKDGDNERHLGDIVKTASGHWLAIPLHYRNLPRSWHKLRRDALGALVNPTA